MRRTADARSLGFGIYIDRSIVCVDLFIAHARSERREPRDAYHLFFLFFPDMR